MPTDVPSDLIIDLFLQFARAQYPDANLSREVLQQSLVFTSDMDVEFAPAGEKNLLPHLPGLSQLQPYLIPVATAAMAALLKDALIGSVKATAGGIKGAIAKIRKSKKQRDGLIRRFDAAQTPEGRLLIEQAIDFVTDPQNASQIEASLTPGSSLSTNKGSNPAPRPRPATQKPRTKASTRKEPLKPVQANRTGSPVKKRRKPR